jgi:release factor glutamine methyltransferase
VQYLTGEAYFRTISVQVGPGVFIPRPETEGLAGWAVERLQQQAENRVAERNPCASPPAPYHPVVVELCAGSGAISRAIAAECPGCAQYAVEVDPVAFAWLRRNADPCPGAHSMQLVHADMADALPQLNNTVDVVVANPPYIPRSDAGLIAPDVLGHEPDRALFGGADGLDALRVVVRVAARLLAPGGWVGIEHDETTGPGARQAVSTAHCFDGIEDHRDLAGRPRFVTAQRLAG